MSNNDLSSCGVGGTCCGPIQDENSKIAKLLKPLSKPIFVAISGVALALALFLPMYKMHWATHFAWVAILICGLPLLHAALYNLFKNKKIRSSLLISTAMIASISIGHYFAAGEIAFIMAIGELLENRTVQKAKEGITRLIELAPETARLVFAQNGETKEKLIGLSEIKLGDIVRVKPGETIPIDGKVIRGSSSIDQSNMTGESLPVDVIENSLVYSGTYNQNGSIDIEVTKLGNDSSIQKMISLMRMAEQSKAPIERIADKWASWLVPTAFVIAILTYIITRDVTRAVTVLVVFCPCALALATPTTVVAGIGQATKNGVLIKNKAALESFAKINNIAFDKTGTLTRGELMATDVVSYNSNYNTEDILQYAASLEMYSEHPLAKSIVDKANGQKLLEVDNFRANTGAGVEGIISGDFYRCGKPSSFNNISEEMNANIEKLSREAKAVVVLEKNKENIGLIAMADSLKENAVETIDNLKALGIENILLTGDNPAAAKQIASKLHIDKVMSNLMPEDKVKAIQKIKEQGISLAMVGDGMNDAPALKTADVSIAMADSGSDISVDAADIVIMGGDISKIPYIKRLSKATLKTIKFNLTMSMIVNFIAITLSVMGVLNPITGALVHNAGSVLVTLNGGMLYKRKV